ncbi:unnamed protein product [Prorocentrum cordatum]|uniref:Exo-alpha-sialidase n=1 Tax=Prorocentrum cordatum TaxID=2364126 RepID=A0ABN9Y9N9_9DINO|nr:unnamed protein product [Polarella glacialis]
MASSRREPCRHAVRAPVLHLPAPAYGGPLARRGLLHPAQPAPPLSRDPAVRRGGPDALAAAARPGGRGGLRRRADRARDPARRQGPRRCTAVGRHAFSDDLGATWSYAEHAAYNGTVAWAGGGSRRPLVAYRRERPHVVLGARGEPRFLSNGVQESTSSDRSWTLVQPLGAGAAGVDAEALLEV